MPFDSRKIDLYSAMLRCAMAPGALTPDLVPDLVPMMAKRRAREQMATLESWTFLDFSFQKEQEGPNLIGNSMRSVSGFPFANGPDWLSLPHELHRAGFLVLLVARTWLATHGGLGESGRATAL